MTGHRARGAVALAAFAYLAFPDALESQGTGRAPDRVGFVASIAPDTVYVGEQVTYALTVRIPTEIRQRLRRNPEFVPPEPRAMLAYDLPLSREPATAEEVEVHVYRRALFALTPGRYAIPAARLTYALPQSPSFFSREEERTLRSDAVAFVAIDPPTRGRPAAWLGAVGQWSVAVRVDADRARVGDPFVLVLRISGAGNATLLPRPPLSIPWADAVASDERIVVDSTPTRLMGAKEFHWLVTPREAGRQVVPPVEYTWFDPSARRYVVGRSAAATVSVGAGDRVALPPPPGRERVAAPLPLRPALEGGSRARIPSSGWWLWVAALLPLPWVTLRVAASHAARASRRERDLAPKGRGAFDEALRSLTGIEPARVTAPGALAQALRLEGVTAETAAAAESLRDDFDRTGFSPPAAGNAAPPADRIAQLSARAVALLRRLADESRRRAHLVVLFSLVGLGGCLDAGGASEAAVRAFAEGRTAYAGKEYARAQEAFLRAAEAAPNDASAWANLGASAWAAHDTAVAVLGWQRALRLEPTSREFRSALGRVRAPQFRGAARVWPVPPLPLALVAMLLWAGAWVLAVALRRTSAPPMPNLAVLGAAMVIAGTAAWLDARLDARQLVVVAETSPLLALPALGADPGAAPLRGEIATVVERRGVWVRLELAGDRTGWYPVERTLALSRD